MRKRNVPFEAVEDGGEGIGEDVVIVDQAAIGTTGAIGNAPTQGFSRTGEDLTDAFAVLDADFIGRSGVCEPAGLDDGEEAPADLGFFLGCEFNGDYPGRKGMIEHSPEAFPNPGGIHDDVLRLPLVSEVLQLAKDGKVIFAGPGEAVDDPVDWAMESGQC